MLVEINPAYDRNTSHILNLHHLCDASEHKQVVTVAPANTGLFICTLRTFSIKTFVSLFFKTGERVIATQRAFRAHFIQLRNDAVQDRKLILLWVEKTV